MNKQTVQPTAQTAQAEMMIQTVTKAATCSLDRKSVVIVTEQTVPQAHLQQQLTMLLRQANQINAQVVRISALLGLITDAGAAAIDQQGPK